MKGVIETSVEHHCIIAKAIMTKDTQAATVAYRLHLEHIRDTTVTVKTKSKSKSSQ
jgi:DNA-binding FadR family transcriptional regulator